MQHDGAFWRLCRAITLARIAEAEREMSELRFQALQRVIGAPVRSHSDDKTEERADGVSLH